MSRINCSVPILTLNSGQYLGRCLESLKDFDDVYLLDGNSTDDTLDIARKYGRPVYQQVETEEKNVMIKNFTEIRIKSLNLAKHDWIFFIDSDEYATEALVREIVLTLENVANNKVAFNIQKKYCIGDRIFEHAFNEPNYYVRLYARSVGVGFRPGKIVHEQMQVPADVKLVNLKNWVYSEVSPTYRDCVKKDVYQLGLMKQTTFSIGAFKSRSHSLRMSLKYFLIAGHILYKSLKVYLKYGYKNSLPIGQVLRHVRVHLIMSGWRLEQSLTANKKIF